MRGCHRSPTERICPTASAALTPASFHSPVDSRSATVTFVGRRSRFQGAFRIKKCRSHRLVNGYDLGPVSYTHLERWQADVTHVTVADGVVFEVLNMIDDHSRVCVASRAFVTTRSADVVRSLHNAAAQWGFPESFLTDNGAIFTASRVNGVGAMEAELLALGIASKHSRPYHPQTLSLIHICVGAGIGAILRRAGDARFAPGVGRAVGSAGGEGVSGAHRGCADACGTDRDAQEAGGMSTARRELLRSGHCRGESGAGAGAGEGGVLGNKKGPPRNGGLWF